MAPSADFVRFDDGQVVGTAHHVVWSCTLVACPGREMSATTEKLPSGST
ncbi:hypothetical protein [Microbispora rosea]|nr:hypothetical protein [Microbispora rosea]